ncbi:protein ALTERED PHOSPHATE STARVATION RESPONSE 1-like [Populus nigra]|uniref:protein ALTERED PHOSPHATE STARVATION RESPONSE 1-like n=1 Tax=Populus nigra TaxID=3691 RepID=UPI002B2670E6|nr:protein ALTERED PHOSPHATE STARVATION RESPONSE 1-like [Populus nigra]
MGCATSKLDDLPAVALCRERCASLEEAIQQRFALAEAHIAYIHSLKRIGSSLHDFIEKENFSSAGVSTKLNLPPDKKGEDLKAVKSSSPKKGHHSYSNSGSHIQFHSDEDDEDDFSHLHHSDNSSPLHSHGEGSGDDGGGGGGGGHIQYMSSEYMNMDQDSFPGGGGRFFHTNYMKNKGTTPSVVYEQRPVSSEPVHFGESSSSAYHGNYSNSGYGMNNSSTYGYSGYPSYGYGGGGYYGPGNQYGSSSPPPAAVASSSKPPPAPPSPLRASAWDFLNVFESYDRSYPQYTPSRNSKELREEEGIPDLEDEDYQHEVVKEVHGDQKYMDGDKSYSKSPVMDDEDGRVRGEPEASLYQARPSVDTEEDRVKYEVHVVDKKIVDNERSEERGNAGFKGGGPLEVAIEIKIQFERASECGNEIAKMLEVGKLPYQRKHASKMLQGVTPPLPAASSQPSTSGNAEVGPPSLEIDEELMMRSKNLSSTLQKLYLWEKKLYQEVKAEEKMRVAHEKKCRKLKHLDERGAEAHKVDSTQTLIRSLSTKIRMAIQVVDKISVTINKIRDEELWPQLNELIQGLTRMWNSMLECHHNQCQAIREARGLGPIGSGKKHGDDHLYTTMQLEHELLNWTSSFSSWIGAQKGYVRSLNNWLVKCLLYEPEETPDGIVPFSPGRMGAPPVFVICNQWAQAMDRISEKEVIDAMRIFASSVFQLWEHDKLEMRQRLMTNKDLESKVRDLDRKDQKIQKKIQALDKKIVLVAGDGNGLSVTGKIVYQSDTSNSSLQGSLQRIFEAMERFMADSMKAYEELVQRSEEERLAREHERVS